MADDSNDDTNTVRIAAEAGGPLTAEDLFRTIELAAKNAEPWKDTLRAIALEQARFDSAISRAPAYPDRPRDERLEATRENTAALRRLTTAVEEFTRLLKAATVTAAPEAPNERTM